MNNPVITHPDQISARWLEAALERAGVLRGRSLAGFEVDHGPSTWSHIARITLRYQDGSDAPPTRLLLKTCSVDEFGPSEYFYHARDYLGLADAPIPRHYDAQYAAASRAYHVLMDDLGATHRNCHNLPPTPEFALAFADALAALHAFRWGPQRIAELGESLDVKGAIKRYVEHSRRGLAPLLAIGGDDLAPAWRPRLSELFERHPALMLQRARDGERLTLIHGDTNPGNVLAPIDGGGPVYLIDRQPFDWSLTVWVGPSDLAYLMCIWWPSELRRQLELPVLRRYHEQLLARGVGGYSWEQLWHDYRLSAAQSVYVPVEWCVLEDDRERMRWLWSAQLARTMAAFDDLRCAELWG